MLTTSQTVVHFIFGLGAIGLVALTRGVPENVGYVETDVTDRDRRHLRRVA